ncbi:MAG: FG-GAP-like repeat-containing protein, partial [bacterium]
MKKIILIVLFLLSICLVYLHPVYSQSEKIHFTGVGAKTNSYVGCNPHGSGFFDYNGDNLPDIFVVSNISEGGWKDKKVPHTLLKNMGNGTFTNVTGQARVGGYLTSAQGFAAADYDNDGYRDLAIGYGVSKYTLLYRQIEPGVFTDYTGTAGLSDWDYRNRGRNITFVDYDNDGLLDFFSFGDDTYSEYSLLVYKNIGNARFTVQTKQAGLDHDRSTTDFWGFAFADIDNDGDMDFFSANNGSVCHLFINKGDGTFKDETTERGLVQINKFYGAIFLDYNNDGWFDLYTRRDKSKSILYKNNKDGTFSDVTLGSGLRETLARPPYGGGLSVADFNNDGYIDILAVSIKGTDFRLYQNNGNGTFTNVAGSANILKYTNFNYTAPIADYNGDGYLDIYLARCDSYPPDYFATLFENDGGSNHWLHVKLIGVQTNRDAIGARVVAYTNGELQMRQVLGGDSYKMDSLPVEFGLGGNSVVDSLIIYWPSGIVQREMLVPADTLITITEEKRIYYHSHLISGQINYYKQNQKVPSVTLQMSGTSSNTTYSNQIGLYKFPVTTGYNNLDVAPSKTPDTDIGECTISAYDAGLAAQAAEDIKPLTGFAAKAADINQNTIIDAVDPLLIARKAVGFANSEGSQAGSWKFDPLTIHIESLVQSDLNDQNFTAWIIGDVDGSWTQSGSQEKEEVNNPAYDQVVLHDSTISINLTAPGSATMQSADLWLEFDTSLFKFREIKTTSMTDGFEFVYNDATPGLVKIALFNSVPIWSYEEFLEIIFEVVPEVIDDTTHMHWILYRIDDTEFDKPDIDIDLRTFSFYGKIKYFQKNNVVPEVTLTLDGIIKDDQSLTNNKGNYRFVGIKAGDNILVTPSKQKGENIGDLVISAYDAFLTARHAVNVEHLYGLTIQVADVDKNGKIEISDAEYIAKAAVGWSDSDNNQVGEWEFSPSSYSYSNVIESMEQDFT